ncbi:hypothetical protein LTR16_003837, partial [Cryomyces antarcticus]
MDRESVQRILDMACAVINQNTHLKHQNEGLKKLLVLAQESIDELARQRDEFYLLLCNSQLVLKNVGLGDSMVTLQPNRQRHQDGEMWLRRCWLSTDDGRESPRATGRPSTEGSHQTLLIAPNHILEQVAIASSVRANVRMPK